MVMWPPPLTQNHVPLVHFCRVLFPPVSLLQDVRVASSSSVASVETASCLYVFITVAVPVWRIMLIAVHVLMSACMETTRFTLTF